MHRDLSAEVRERRNLLARYHLVHRCLPPRDQRDLPTLRRLVGSAQNMSRAAAMEHIDRNPLARQALDRAAELGTDARPRAAASKSYSELKPAERAELAKSDPDRFARMKAEQAGRIAGLESRLAAATTYAEYREAFDALQRELGA